MYCMKCGKETQSNQVFCESCLQVMDAYPEKPDAAIQLPNRHQQPAVKKSAHRKKAIPLEEQVLQLKKANRRLSWACMIFAWLLSFCIGMAIYQLTAPKDNQSPSDNKNYTYASEVTDAG